MIGSTWAWLLSMKATALMYGRAGALRTADAITPENALRNGTASWETVSL